MNTHPPTQTPPDEPLFNTVGESAARLKVGRSTIYELLASGEIESVTIGRSRRIPVSALDDYVERLRAEARPDGDLATGAEERRVLKRTPTNESGPEAVADRPTPLVSEPPHVRSTGRQSTPGQELQ